MYIDVNVSHGNWPFQVFPLSTLKELKEHLKGLEINRFLVSHLGTVFNPDTDHFNQELLAEAVDVPEAIPVPVIHPGLTGWERLLHQYIESGVLKAVKLYPGFHLYELRSEAVHRLAAQLLEWNLPLMIQVRLEDERSQYRGLTVKPVATDDLIEFHQAFPGLKLVCLNTYFGEAKKLAEATDNNVFLDVAFTEHGNTIDFLTRFMSPERLLMGSHSPFLYTRSATIKLEHNTQEESVRKQIAQDNARRVFGI